MTNMWSYDTIHLPPIGGKVIGTQFSPNPGPIHVADWARDAHSLLYMATIM